MQESLPKQCVIYCRVSTKEQVEEGNSLTTQERLCKEYAAKHGFIVASLYVEQGESAKTADRTQLQKLIRFCTIKKNRINAVIVYKIDRLSRNTDDYSQIRIMFKRYGIEIKSVSEHFEDTPAGRFMENIIANVAQFDNDVRAERCIGGMKEAVKEGRYVWMAPFGYSNVRVNGKATIAPNESASVIQTLFKMIAESKKSLEAIRVEMGTKGLVKKNGETISKSSFYRLIRLELYCGEIRKFGARYEGTFEPVISKELFYHVQNIISDKPVRIVTKRTEDFPLRRFLQHSSGKAVTGCWSKGKNKKYPYYMVHGNSFNIRKEVLEKVFIEWLDTYKLDIRCFQPLTEMIRDELKNIEKTRKEKQSANQAKEKQLIEKRTMVINKNLQGVIPDDSCKELLNQIAAELYQLSQQNEFSESIPDIKEITAVARMLMFHPGKIWEQASFNNKQLLQSFYFPKGIVISESGSRTPKICKLFKANVIFPIINSLNVHHSDSESNTDSKQISLGWKKLEVSEQHDTSSDLPTTNELIEELSHISEQIKGIKAGE
jgi:DNA invertase Pin-like site-specific DNA recombinase